MSRRKKAKNAQPSAGFVPASQDAARKRNSQKLNSIDFGAANEADLRASVNQYSRSNVDYSQRKRGMGTGKKVLIALLIVVLVGGVGGLGFYVFKELQKDAINQDLHGMTQEELQAVDNELTGMTTFDEPFTMLLLGSDARSDNPDMGARTDTIVLTRVDPTTNNVTMLSIPRDTMITIDGVGTQKFNAAYTYGGPSGTIAAVKNLCGVDIDHYAEINFEGLVGLIDAIGGIDVMVDETIDDPDAGPIVIPAGLQHLDGESSLVFSRSRAYADGDYTRVSNQRKVIEAIIHRGLEAPASELYGLVQSSTGFLSTDSGMDVDFIFSLADQMRHNNDYPLTLTTATLPSSTAMIDGISYVIADDQGVADIIRVFLEGGDVSDPYGERAAAEAAAAAEAGETAAGEGEASVAEEALVTESASFE